MRGRVLMGLLALTMLLAGKALANDPFVYFAGNPANSWYTVEGTCDAPTLTAVYLYFLSGDVTSANLPARWLALPFELCQETTFDSIAYAPAFHTGVPNLRIIITGARTGGDGLPEPDLGNVIYDQNLGPSPGDPPIPGEKDEPILTYYGGAAGFLYLRTTPLGTTLTLQPGLYFAIIVGDEDFAICGPDSYIALAMGAPGGPKLYYTPRGLGSSCSAPTPWQRFRYNPAAASWPCERILNTDLPWRSGDPFAGTPPWNTGQHWKDNHSPYLYHGVLGFRYSGAASGKVTGTAILADAPSPSPPTNVEVIFYKPGTKQRVARFSMPTADGPTYSIDTPLVAAGTYDIVVRPIYSPSILSINCPTNLCVTNVTFDPNTHWLGVRIPNVNVSGTVDLGTITLPNGDTNGDMQVDDADLLNILFAFGGTDAAADLNGDNTVDDADLLITLFNFGVQGEDGDEACGG